MKQHRKGKVKWIPHIILCILVLTIACSTAYATEAYQTGQQVEANAIIVEKNTRCACERDVVNVSPVITK